MIKTLNSILKQDRERFKVPRSVQQAVPIEAVWGDGIFQVGRSKSIMPLPAGRTRRPCFYSTASF